MKARGRPTLPVNCIENSSPVQIYIGSQIFKTTWQRQQPVNA